MSAPAARGALLSPLVSAIGVPRSAGDLGSAAGGGPEAAARSPRGGRHTDTPNSKTKILSFRDQIFKGGAEITYPRGSSPRRHCPIRRAEIKL